MKNLLIAVPTMGSIHNMLVERLLRWSKDCPNFYFTNRVAPTDRARNEIVQFFLAQPHLTHLMMVDSDTIPPIDAPQKMLLHDLPFVTALTPIMSQDKETGGYQFFDNCFLEPERDKDGNIIKTHIAQRDTGIKEIFRCGAACMMIHRDVLENIPAPHFKFEYNANHTLHTRSEDIYFTDLMREHGYDLYADTSIYCHHEKAAFI